MNEHLSDNLQLCQVFALADGTVEQIRAKYIKHEASVKSIGTLYIIGALFLLIAGIVGPVVEKKDPIAIRIAVAASLISLGAFQFWVAGGLRKLKSWAKIPVGVLSGIGLLGFPLGTVINGYILYLVFSQKGAMVFSPEYQQVMAATPQIKYKTSIVVWIFLGILVALIAIALLAALFAK